MDGLQLNTSLFGSLFPRQVDLIVKLQRHRKPTTPSQSVGTTSTERSPALGLFPSGRGTLPPRYAQPPSLHEEQLDDVTGAKPSEGFGLSTNSEPAPETSAPPPLPRGEDKASSSAAGLDNSGGDPPVDDLASRIAAAAAGVTFEARMNGLTEVEVLQQRRGGGGGRPGGSFPTATTSTEQVDPVRRGAGGFGGASSSSTADGGKFSFGSLPESKKEEVRLGSESEEDAGLPGKESSSRRPAGLPGKPNSSTGGRGPIGDNSGAGARHQPFTGPGEDVEEQEPIEDAVEDAYDEDFDEDDGLDALLSDLSSASDKAKARPADGAESRPTTNGFGTNGTNDPPKRSLLGDLPSLGGRGAGRAGLSQGGGRTALLQNAEDHDFFGISLMTAQLVDSNSGRHDFFGRRRPRWRLRFCKSKDFVSTKSAQTCDLYYEVCFRSST